MQLHTWDIVKWALLGGGFSLVVLPAVKYWLGKGYVENKSFEDYKLSFDRYKNECDEAADHRQALLLSETRNIRELIQPWFLKVEQNGNRLTRVETQMELFWKSLEKSMANMLHRDDTPNIDRLLEKLPVENLTEEELKEFMQHLEQIENDSRADQGRRAGAALLRASITARYA